MALNKLMLCGLLGVSILTSTRCTRQVDRIDYNIKYPYRVEINSGLSDLGAFEASILSETTFQVGEYIFTQDLEEQKIIQIELPKTSANTKENYRDNIIDEQNLSSWMNKGNVKYEIYKNSLNVASRYLTTINSVLGMNYGITGNEYKFEEYTAPYNGEDCRVLRYKAYDGVAFDICELLGAHGIVLDELPEQCPVYITYYVNSENEVVYIGCEASDAVSYLVSERDGTDKEYHSILYEIYTGEG